MSSHLNVAFLGARHPHVFPRLALCKAAEDVQIRGIYDHDPSVTAAVSDQYGIPAASTAEQLLSVPGLDLVIIDGFDYENPGYVELAARRCRAMLIEKPGAPTLAAMEQMVATIRAANVHAQLGYIYSHSPVVRKVKAILQSGVMGPITLARFHAGAPVGCGAEIWQSLPQDMGGTFYTDGCHMLDLVIHLLGAPAAARGSVLKLADGPAVVSDIYKDDQFAGLGGRASFRIGSLVHEDAAAAILEYPNLIATFDVTSWEAHNWVEAWSMEFFGANGTLRVSLVPPAYKLWVRHGAEGWDPGWHAWEGNGTAVGTGASLVADENYANEMADLFARLREEGPPDLTRLEEGLAVVRTVDSVYRSAGWLERK
jgi:predicted dehydrogenase